MAPSDPASMAATVEASPRFAKYAEPIDRESAREKLAARLEAGAGKAEKEAPRSAPKSKPAPRRTDKKDDGGVISDVVKSGAFKDFVRTAAREIARGMFKTGRR